MTKPEIILASASPRRAELLKKILKDFKIVASGFDESKLDHSDPVAFAKKASYEKARDVASRNFDALVIGADTIVVNKGGIYGKPKDLKEAKAMLKALSGRTHQVITGVTLFRNGRSVTGHAETEVTFNPLSEKDIDDYLKDSRVLDKAGSYAIQEIGDKFVKKIKGERDNVVGLPVALLKEMLRLFQ
jgi:septum formation protein